MAALPEEEEEEEEGRLSVCGGKVNMRNGFSLISPSRNLPMKFIAQKCLFVIFFPFSPPSI